MVEEPEDLYLSAVIVPGGVDPSAVVGGSRPAGGPGLRAGVFPGLATAGLTLVAFASPQGGLVRRSGRPAAAPAPAPA